MKLRWLSPILSVLTVVCFLACARTPSADQAPETSAEPWRSSKVLEIEQEREENRIDISLLLGSPRTISLIELVDVGLATNPRTRASWLQTRISYSAIGEARSEYYPKVDLGTGIDRSRRTSDARTSESEDITIHETEKGPFITIDWLLFDFGGRESRIDERQYSLLAANYAHNAAIQREILRTQTSYYLYVSLKHLADTQRAALEEARTNYEATEARKQAGVATIADVLQAKTALSRAQLNLQTTEGRVQSVRGSVLTSVGLSPEDAWDVEDLRFEEIKTDDISSNVSELLDVAVKNNPSLSEARVQVLGAESRVYSELSSGLPALRATARGDRFYDDGDYNDEYLGALEISFPLFTGFEYSERLERTRKEAKKSYEDFRNLREDREIAIWNDYFAFQTAIREIETTKDLFKSAQQSKDVAFGRYKEGVGSILDLLSAQAALQEARSLVVESRTKLLLSLSQLRFDMGTLDIESLTKK
jgi:outer membrane protein